MARIEIPTDLLEPEQYQAEVGSVSFTDIYFKSGDWLVRPETLGEKNRIEVGFETEKTIIDPTRVTFEQNFKLRVRTRHERKFPVIVNCVIVTNCVSDWKHNEKFWRTYEVVSLPVITVPFFREFVHSMTSKMGIAPIIVPPWTR